jgi:hypothetical protein
MNLRHPNEVESARQARRSIGLIRRKLLNPAPEVLDACTPHLRTAIGSLENLQQLLATSTSRPGPARTALQTEVAELRRELNQVNSLMRNACGFYTGLGRLLAPDNDGTMAYAPSGPVAIRRASTLQLEG